MVVCILTKAGPRHLGRALAEDILCKYPWKSNLKIMKLIRGGPGVCNRPP